MRTSILGIIVSAAVGAFAFFGVALPADADSVIISGSGVWGPNTTPVNKFAAPNASFSFSFALPNPILSDQTGGTNFEWTLNGVKQLFDSPHIDVQFFTAADAGMFDLIPKKDEFISFYGPDIGTSLTFVDGQYDVAAGTQRESATGTANVTVTLSPLTVTVTAFEGEGVPETSTWVMMTLGFAGLAFAGYRRSRKRALVA